MLAADPRRPLRICSWWWISGFPAVRDARSYLIIEALAARRNRGIARPMRDCVGERGDSLAELVRLAHADGGLETVAVAENALAHSASSWRWAAR